MKGKIKVFFDYSITNLENRVNDFIKNNWDIDNIIDIKHNVICNSDKVLHYLIIIYN